VPRSKRHAVVAREEIVSTCAGSAWPAQLVQVTPSADERTWNLMISSTVSPVAVHVSFEMRFVASPES